MEKFLELINTNIVYMSIFILSLVLIKYGVLGFVLSKKVKKNFTREKIDLVFTLIVLIGLFLLNRNREISIASNNTVINIVYIVISVILYYTVNIVIGEKLGQGKTKNQLQIEKLTKEVPFFISLISTGILAPVFEEIVFRFYIQDLIFGNTILAIFISSLLFSLMHMVSGFSISGFLTYMGASVVVGVLYVLTGGILYTALMHIIVNSLAVIFMYFGEKLKTKYE